MTSEDAASAPQPERGGHAADPPLSRDAGMRGT